MKQNAKNRETTREENPDVVIVKTATAPKLSPRGEGGIVYQIGRVGDVVYIRIEKNEGGGSHSREFVPVSAIRSAFTPAMKKDEHFKSDAFSGTFVGRSQCNSGFLVASLRAERLLTADAEHKGMSRLTGDLDAWETALRKSAALFVDGKPVTVKLHPEPKDTNFRPKRANGVETPGGIPPEVKPDMDDDGDAQNTSPQKGRRAKQPKGEHPAIPEELDGDISLIHS